eukprot:TRINITY_DN6970_c0_g1_i1.p1 TRINITY_DN6970_c0_g1~~TRINITY_DN6970_c0_g1_i1.p1  ORF type:complete len:308 (+),score=46.10 TRINITY_DN6970_c0_g1_i1:3-926(+)
MILFIVVCCLFSRATKACDSPIIAGRINVTIDGQVQSLYLAQTGVTDQHAITSGNNFTFQHNSRFFITDRCTDSFEPDMFTNFFFLNKTLRYEIDLSQAGCGCNVAFYAVRMPGFNSSQDFDPSKKGDYYCDANRVGGNFCPEMDIMEANTVTFQTTPHSCNETTGRYYDYCDGGGCGMRTYRQDQGSYGPGDSYTIDTRQRFEAAIHFRANSGGQLMEIDTVLRQAGKQVQLTNNGSHCKNGREPEYLAGMTTPLEQGMVAVFSFWGDTGSTMSWLDVPPCSVETSCPDVIWASINNIVVEDINEK